MKKPRACLVLCAALASACRGGSEDEGPFASPIATALAQDHGGHAGHARPGAPAKPSAAPSARPPMPGHAEHRGQHPAPDAGVPAPAASGLAPIMIDAAQAKALNLTTAVVEERAFDKTLRTVGVVVPDERRTSHVHAKVRGWVEGVRASFVGQKVRRGETLCAIYSQEVLAAEIEFLALVDRTAPLPKGPFAEAEQQARDQLVAAARRRLSLWDVPRAEIARLEKEREPRRTFALAAPRSGTIVAKQALDGMFIDPSVELYLVSDLERVWVLADVYEADLPNVRVGDAARLKFNGSQHAAAEATVAFVAPTVEEATRTVKVRFELDNREGHLRPGTFATVEMDLKLGGGLAVPESAVIRTGTRAIVFVVHGEHVEPREVALGQSVGGFYRVESGLAPGDRVATGAQFLLDSESRLRATSGPGRGHGGH